MTREVISSQPSSPIDQSSRRLFERSMSAGAEHQPSLVATSQASSRGPAPVSGGAGAPASPDPTIVLYRLDVFICRSGHRRKKVGRHRSIAPASAHALIARPRTALMALTAKP